MSSAFQSGAFQGSAFQALTPAGPAFQCGAFERTAFQSCTGTATQPRFVPGPIERKEHEQRGHIHFPRFKTREEIRRARDELLGITPAAEKVVSEAAKQVIAKAAQQDASPAPPDALAWLQQHQKQQAAQLSAELKRRRIKADANQKRQFLILLGIEIQRELSARREAEETRIRKQQEQDDEDIQIITLMLDM